MRRLLLAPALVLAACSGSAPAPGPDGGTGANEITLDRYLAADSAFGCLAYGCLFGIAPSELPAFCGSDDAAQSDRRRAVAAGRLAFDPQKAKGCVPALEAEDAATCWGPGADFEADVDRLLAACDGVLTGRVSNGGDCVRSEECAQGFCDATAAACPGRCQPRRPVGGACASAAMCEDGLLCAGSKCVTAGGPGEGCSADAPCRQGLFCAGGSCAAPLAKAESCDPSADHCAKGLYCAPNPAGAGGACADRLPAGASCAIGSGGTLGIASPQCAGNQVCVGLVTDDSGGVLFPGTCGTPSDLVGACAPPNGRTGADPADSGCFQGITCDGTSSRCRKFPGPGEACPDLSCDQTAYCDAGTCHALKKDGESCTKSSECEHLCTTAGSCASPAANACHAN